MPPTGPSVNIVDENIVPPVEDGSEAPSESVDQNVEVDAEGNIHPSMSGMSGMPASGLLATITVQVSKVSNEGQPTGEPTDISVHLNEGEDPEVVAFNFCAENADVNYLQEIRRGLVNRVRNTYGNAKADSLPSAPTLDHAATVKRAERHMLQNRVMFAAIDFSRVDLFSRARGLPQAVKHLEAAEALIADEQWGQANDQLELAEKSSQEMKRNIVFLQKRAMMYWNMDKYWSVYSVCARLLKVASHRGDWKDDQARTKCVRLAAKASLQMGNIDNCKKAYAIALKADPDAPVKAAFKAVQKLARRMKNAQKQLDKGYNHRALTHIEAGLKLLNKDSKSANIQALMLLIKCTAQSRMKRHEAAIDSCSKAIEHFKTSKTKGLKPDPFKLVKAYDTRAEAHTNDNNFNEARHDYRSALTVLEEIGAEESVRDEMNHKWRNAQHREKQWNENLDAIAVLKLPLNVEEVSLARRCKFLKKQFKKLTKKWHPDKAKGDKKRAARKFNEVAEAKRELHQRWDCRHNRR